MKFLQNILSPERRKIKGDVIDADQETLEILYPKSRWSYPSKYQGEEIICSQCKVKFIFSAKDKQSYYESEGGNIYAKIHMCKHCYASTKNHV